MLNTKLIAALIFLLSITCAAVQRQPNSDYRARRVKAAAKSEGAAILIFAGTESEGPNALYGFRQDDDFYYLAGLTDPGPALLIVPARTASAGSPAVPYTEILFLPAHNVTDEKWTGPKLGADTPKVKDITGFDNVETLDRMHDELVRLLPSNRARVLTNLPIEAPPLDWLRRTNSFPNYITIGDGKPLIGSLRLYKDAGEVQLIRNATDASIAAHMAAMKAMRPGLNEHDIATLMQYEFMKKGCERPSYAPIVGSGFYSTVLHYSADDQPIRDGDVVVMDVAGEYSMYASDITRTLPANGHFTARQKEIYNIVLGAQQAAIQAFKVSQGHLNREMTYSLYQAAYDYINTHGKDMHGQPLGQYFIHGLSHYVGLNVHDVGEYSVPLDKGMVFTIEPGIYIPEEKIGVRIEDLFWVDNSGNLVELTKGLPKTAEEVEAAMKAK